MKARKIFIAWKKSEGSRRYIIAKIKRNASDGITFELNSDILKKAKENGLEHFFGFKNVDSLKPEEIEKLLSLRIPERTSYLSFWNAEKDNDTFDLLALTQGKLPTDNFEFLACYDPSPGLEFVTDLAGLSHINLTRDSVVKGDILTYKKESNNKYDPSAIAIYKGDLKVGYIKQIHNKVFGKVKGSKPTLVVKTVDQNGKIKQIFVSVKFPDNIRRNKR